MDKELFKQKLSEVAEWKIPKPTAANKASGIKRKYSRPKKQELEEESMSSEDNEDNEDNDLGISEDQNVTLPVQLLEAKIQSCQCSDCGKFCEHGRKKESQFYFKAGKKFIREKCATCKLHKDPNTGKFSLSAQQAPTVWYAYLYAETVKKKPNKVITTEENGRWVEQTENDQEIIRKYLD